MQQPFSFTVTCSIEKSCRGQYSEHVESCGFNTSIKNLQWKQRETMIIFLLFAFFITRIQGSKTATLSDASCLDVQGLWKKAHIEIYTISQYFTIIDICQTIDICWKPAEVSVLFTICKVPYQPAGALNLRPAAAWVPACSSCPLRFPLHLKDLKVVWRKVALKFHEIPNKPIHSNSQKSQKKIKHLPLPKRSTCIEELSKIYIAWYNRRRRLSGNIPLEHNSLIVDPYSPRRPHLNTR